jgi:hypothetical protein
MHVLRAVAISSNIAFIAYGTSDWLPPVLLLHMVLLPLNIVRLAEIVMASRTTRDLAQPEAVAQTLGADPTRGQSPVVLWLIFWPISSPISWPISLADFPGRFSWPIPSARRRQRTQPSQSNEASHLWLPSRQAAEYAMR